MHYKVWTSPPASSSPRECGDCCCRLTNWSVYWIQSVVTVGYWLWCNQDCECPLIVAVDSQPLSFVKFSVWILSGFSQRSFAVSGPDAWNSLPRQLRGIAVSSTFKHHLKSELFFQAYGVSTIASTVADPWDCLRYWLMFFHWQYVCFLHF